MDQTALRMELTTCVQCRKKIPTGIFPLVIGTIVVCSTICYERAVGRLLLLGYPVQDDPGELFDAQVVYEEPVQGPYEAVAFYQNPKRQNEVDQCEFMGFIYLWRGGASAI